MDGKQWRSLVNDLCAQRTNRHKQVNIILNNIYIYIYIYIYILDGSFIDMEITLDIFILS